MLKFLNSQKHYHFKQEIQYTVDYNISPDHMYTEHKVYKLNLNTRSVCLQETTKKCTEREKDKTGKINKK